jgi:hypothetical protein
MKITALLQPVTRECTKKEPYDKKNGSAITTYELQINSIPS